MAITGASGAIYTQRLLDRLDPTEHEVHVITSSYAKIILKEELPDGLRLAEGVQLHAAKSMNVPFASGSNAFDAMVTASLVVSVVRPQSTGLGGGGFLVYHDAASGEEKKTMRPGRFPVTFSPSTSV